MSKKEGQERKFLCLLSNLCLGGKGVPSEKEIFTGNSEKVRGGCFLFLLDQEGGELVSEGCVSEQRGPQL